MNERWRFVLTVGAALGSGLVAGVFFAFSTFVMAALARLTPPNGIAAMQAINITAINPAFMIVSAATLLASLVLAGSALVARDRPDALLLIAGAICYAIGAVLFTILFNIPRNDALAVVDPQSAEGARLWADYLVSWTRWNHVRMFASLAAAAFFTLALRRMG